MHIIGDVFRQYLTQPLSLRGLLVSWPSIPVQNFVEFAEWQIRESAPADLLLGHFAVQMEWCHGPFAEQNALIHLTEEVLVLEHLVRLLLLVIFQSLGRFFGE